MINTSHFVTAIVTCFLLICVGNTYAVQFQECNKFLNKDKRQHSVCLEYSFSEAVRNSEYEKIRNWLENHPESNKGKYSDYLTILMCGNHANMVEGDKPFKAENRKEIIKTTEHLLGLGASFNAMPYFSIVTPLFCISNRQDSEILDFVLTRIKATSKDLDQCHYEGSDPAHVPLYRAILNNDLESAKVLVKHGASPDFSATLNETTLKVALEKHKLIIANWLIDIGASVHKRDEEKGCSGKSALDYALEISKDTKGRDQIVSRIKELMLKPSRFKNNCSRIVE